MRINRKEIVEKFAGRAGISQEIVRQIVDIFFEEIAAALERGERGRVQGLWFLHPEKIRGLHEKKSGQKRAGLGPSQGPSSFQAV